MENKKRMNKSKFWVGALIGFFTSLLVVLVILAAGAYTFFRIRVSDVINVQTTGISENVDNSQEIDLDKVNDKIRQLEGLVEEYFLFQEDVTKVEDGIYKGLMNGLEDPYSVYYNAEDYKAVTTDTSGIYSGIGAVVSKNADTGVVTILKVFEGSPGQEAGIQVNDIIYKVNGEEINHLELDVLVSSLIRGKEGTNVDITVLRGEELEEVTMTVTRRNIEVPTVEHKMLENHIGYIAVSQFDLVTYEQFVTAIDELSVQGMKNLIIDMRNNPGGILETCVEMMDYVLPEGKLVYTADKNGNGDEYFSDDGHELNIPMVIIVNKYSASASEVFTGAVKDFKKGTILGETTYGKGIVQNLIPLGDGTAIKITTQHYYTPSGFDLHKKGIEPDIVVELDKNAKMGDLESDNQLQEAIKRFQ